MFYISVQNEFWDCYNQYLPTASVIAYEGMTGIFKFARTFNSFASDASKGVFNGNNYYFFSRINEDAFNYNKDPIFGPQTWHMILVRYSPWVQDYGQAEDNLTYCLRDFIVDPLD